jgi:hypothetical protein
VPNGACVMPAGVRAALSEDIAAMAVPAVAPRKARRVSVIIVSIVD